MKKSVVLSSSNLKNIPYCNYSENNFKIKIDDQEIEIPFIYADFLSPLICKIHRSDPEFSFISFSTKCHSNKILTDEVKNALHNISIGAEVEINNEMSYKLRIISMLLENEELYKYLSKNFPIDDKLYLQYLLDLTESNLDIYLNSYEQFDKGIEYISRNFYKIEKSKLLKLPQNALLTIISNEKLTINDEDSLLDFIQEYFSAQQYENDDILPFYEQVDFRSLSKDKLSELIKNIGTNISEQIWTQIQQCLYFNYQDESETVSHLRHRTIFKKIKFDFDGNGNNRFNGIIRYLTNKCGGNVHQKGIVEVSGDCNTTKWSEDPRSRLPEYAVDFDNSNYFDSFFNKDGNMNHLQYDFKERRVNPVSYSIKSRYDEGRNGHHLKSWIIEGRNNENESWTKLDLRENDETINGANLENNFMIRFNHENKYFRYLRIGCILNAAGDKVIVLSKLEFYGSMIEKEL